MTGRENIDTILSFLTRFIEHSAIWEEAAFGPATFLFDLTNGYYCTGNTAAETLFGNPKGVPFSIAGCIERVYPADRELLFQYILPHARKFAGKLLRNRRKQVVFSFNIRVKDSDGNYMTLLLKSIIVEEDPASALVVLTNIFDITGHHKDNSVTYTIESNNADGLTGQVAKLLHKDSFHPKEKIAGLTERESEILHYICEGYSSKQIANKLGVSIYTINNHRKNILRKTGQSTVSGIVKYALEYGYKKQNLKNT